MDAALFILLEEDPSAPCNVKYPWLEPKELSAWAWKLLPARLQGRNFAQYAVTFEALQNMEAAINGYIDTDDADAANIIPAILRSGRTWVLAFLWQWDEVSSVAATTPDAATEQLLKELRGSGERRGFILYGEAPTAELASPPSARP